MVEKPDGIVISLAFVVGIVLISLVSRLARATELRADAVEFDEEALRLIDSLRGRRQPAPHREQDPGR